MLNRALALLILSISANTFADSDTYLEKYPVGYISENLLFDLMNQNRDKLRECHQNYLKKLPGDLIPYLLNFRLILKVMPNP
jgi:hypothetical protein